MVTKIEKSNIFNRKSSGNMKKLRKYEKYVQKSGCSTLRVLYVLFWPKGYHPGGYYGHTCPDLSTLPPLQT